MNSIFDRLKDRDFNITEEHHQQIKRLDAIQNALEEGISCAEIIDSSDLFHEEIDEVVRAIILSVGTRETALVFGSNCYIHEYHHLTIPESPKHLIIEVCMILKNFLP